MTGINKGAMGFLQLLVYQVRIGRPVPVMGLVGQRAGRDVRRWRPQLEAYGLAVFTLVRLPVEARRCGKTIETTHPLLCAAPTSLGVALIARFDAIEESAEESADVAAK